MMSKVSRLHQFFPRWAGEKARGNSSLRLVSLYEPSGLVRYTVQSEPNW